MKEVFEILGETISDEEVNTMIKIAGIKSNDKINFMEFKDFFYKIDWYWICTNTIPTTKAIATKMHRDVLVIRLLHQEVV